MCDSGDGARYINALMLFVVMLSRPEARAYQKMAAITVMQPIDNV